MSHPNPSTAISWVIVDELVRHGISHSVISPGSRSTSPVLALDDHPAVDVVVHIDERSAGFRGLGISVATGVPALVVTTSGSAVANLLPAVVEADRSGVPLLLFTADRPSAMVERRTNQTMDQKSVFSGFLRMRVDLGPAIDLEGQSQLWRNAVSDAVAAAMGSKGVPGPVQINVAFEEPTVPVTDDGRAVAARFRSSTHRIGKEAPPPLAGRYQTGSVPSVVLGRRTVLIAGRGDYDITALVEMSGAAGIPVIATALSGGRGDRVVSSYHHLLASGVPEDLLPDGVIVVGQPGPSDRLNQLMRPGTEVVHVDCWGLFSDVSGTMTRGVRDDPVTFLSRSAVDQEQGWSDLWHGTDHAVREALDRVLDSAGEPTGPGIGRSLNGVEWSALVVSSSLPIRDVDAQLMRSGWVHSNRGVSGIDGFASTVLGVAGFRQPTLGFVGDLSFLHDSNAFLTDRVPPAVFLLVDNQGGGMFDLLPQARFAPDFDRLFVTPPHRDLAGLARFHGLDYVSLESIDGIVEELSDALSKDRVTVVRVPVDRRRDVEMRHALDEAARDVLSV